MPEDPFQVRPFGTLSSKQLVAGSNPAWDAIPPGVALERNLMQSGYWCTWSYPRIHLQWGLDSCFFMDLGTWMARSATGPSWPGPGATPQILYVRRLAPAIGIELSPCRTSYRHFSASWACGLYIERVLS